MTDHIPESAGLEVEPEAEQAPDYSAELIAFAARLKAEPEAVQVKYQYCLVTLQEERGQAKLARVELRGRQAWCTYKLAGGGEITVLRPSLTTVQEQEMVGILREIFPQAEIEAPSLPTDIIVEAVIPPPPPEPPPVVKEAAAEAAELDQLIQVNMRSTREAAQSLQQMVEQARAVTYALKKVIAETQQATQAAWTAVTEQRLLLVEIRSAIRRYERVRLEAELSQQEGVYQEPEITSRPRQVSERDKQIVLSVLNGASFKTTGQALGLSPSRIKQIFSRQLRHLHRLSTKLGLAEEDLAAIEAQEQSYPSPEHRPDASRVIELLKNMWGSQGD